MTEEAESPTRYMLPEQVEGETPLVDYSLNEYSPAKYPIATKKKRKKKKNKDKEVKKSKGNAVHFDPKVRLKTIYHSLKDKIEDIDLAQEEDYPLRTTALL